MSYQNSYIGYGGGTYVEMVDDITILVHDSKLEYIMALVFFIVAIVLYLLFKDSS